MERKQIIKALECCTSLGGCYGCPLSYDYAPTTNCKLKLLKSALALINELTEELAEAESEAEKAISIAEGNIRAEIASGGTSCHWCEDKVKADTVRKMQERLKNRIEHSTYNANTERKTVRKEELLEQVNWVYKEVVPNLIDQIAKEMLEEK